jgi:hypothetical protein
MKGVSVPTKETFRFGNGALAECVNYWVYAVGIYGKTGLHPRFSVE